VPAKTAKATKVAIIAVHGSSVLDSMSGNQGIADKRRIVDVNRCPHMES